MNRTFRFALLGAGALGLAGTALAAGRDLHVMNVSLPDGSVAQVQYRGDVAPRVVAVPVARVAMDPFAEMDAMFAAMQAQHARMMQQVAAMQAAAAAQATTTGAPVTTVSVNGKPVALPAGGSYFYSVTTTSNGKASCTQTVTMTGDGKSGTPQVQRASSGDCDSAVARNPAPVPASVETPAAPAPRAPAPVAAPARVPPPPGTHPA